MQYVNTPAYQYGVKCARQGIIMKSHYSKPENVAAFVAGWQSVDRSHAAVITDPIDGEISVIHVGTKRECEDGAATYQARHPGARVRVVAGKDVKKI
ncbi:hypothetical protein CHUUTOTORO_01980 [Serratia phage vB_SmaM-ChuuTotoro]|nr:hypothetical protein CHUUTOTORO_01980 [Serratia phage vB_SmaM-ChuuTotoro]